MGAIWERGLIRAPSPSPQRNSTRIEDLFLTYLATPNWTEYTEFLEQGCDAALFGGMHARAGTPQGVMNHTISGRDYQNLWFNGTLVGEASMRPSAERGVVRC